MSEMELHDYFQGFSCHFLEVLLSSPVPGMKTRVTRLGCGYGRPVGYLATTWEPLMVLMRYKT